MVVVKTCQSTKKLEITIFNGFTKRAKRLLSFSVQVVNIDVTSTLPYITEMFSWYVNTVSLLSI